MANKTKWTYGAATAASPTTIFSTDLNSLANNTQVTAAAEFSNGTNMDLYADLILDLASLTPVAPNRIDIYILASYDGGTNFPAPAAADLRLRIQDLWCSFMLGTTAAVQRAVMRNLLMPPQDFKLVFDNQAGVSLASSGNTLKIVTYNIDNNG